jgi:hypothetical protein
MITIPSKKDKWIQKAFSGHNKGALHRQLGIPQDKTIGKAKLRKIVATPIGKKAYGHTVTRLLKARSNLALNANKRR